MVSVFQKEYRLKESELKCLQRGDDEISGLYKNNLQYLSDLNWVYNLGGTKEKQTLLEGIFPGWFYLSFEPLCCCYLMKKNPKFIGRKRKIRAQNLAPAPLFSLERNWIKMWMKKEIRAQNPALALFLALILYPARWNYRTFSRILTELENLNLSLNWNSSKTQFLKFGFDF